MKNKFETDAIRLQAERSQQREHSVPLYLTSSFAFDDAEQMRAMFADEEPGNIYSRFTNPNVDEFVAKMCALEGAEAGYATATGMAAMFCAVPMWPITAKTLSWLTSFCAARTAFFGS